jgi:hypothetical protein
MELLEERLGPAIAEDLSRCITKEDLSTAFAAIATSAEMRRLHQELVEHLNALGEAIARSRSRGRKKQ